MGKQQSTNGKRGAGAIWYVQWVMQVTPYARIQNWVVWRRRAAKNFRLPFFWVQNGPKNTQITINR